MFRRYDSINSQQEEARSVPTVFSSKTIIRVSLKDSGTTEASSSHRDLQNAGIIEQASSLPLTQFNLPRVSGQTQSKSK
jgi:hypothetical protein